MEDYVLVFQAAEYRIVTERDIAEMHAKIIDLTPDTPQVTTARIRAEIEKVPSDSNKLVTALEQLRRMSVDATFAAEWVERYRRLPRRTRRRNPANQDLVGHQQHLPLSAEREVRAPRPRKLKLRLYLNCGPLEQ